MKESELFEFFHTLGIVPVVKIDDAAKAEALAGAMCRGGINCAEVTFRTDAAEEAIKRMVKAYPEMVVGAGTVLNPETAERAVKAGASFIVSRSRRRHSQMVPEEQRPRYPGRMYCKRSPEGRQSRPESSEVLPR